jgi:outer membrane protein assembly factor BamB
VKHVTISRVLVMATTVLLVACGGGASGDSSSAAARAHHHAARHIPGADWTQFNFDAQRSGAGPARTGINSRTVGSLRARVVHLNGTVDSAPIELHAVRVKGRSRDVIVVTTTYGRTIALAAATGRRLWEFTPSDIRAYEHSYKITNATPIADPNRRFVYAATPDGFIHKLALASGHEVRSGRWPARITFDPTHEKITSALNINGSSVVATTGGYIGDAPPYQGHLVMIDRRSGKITAVLNTLCSDIHHLINPPSRCGFSDSAIWSRAGAVIEPGTRRMLVATGNATFNGSTAWGDSVLEISADGRRLLHKWTPANQAVLARQDTDLGSTSPALLPPLDGFRLAVQGGKDEHLHVLDLDRLDGTTGGPGPRLGGELADLPAPGPDQVFTQPAVWTHAGRTYLFVADGAATAAYVLKPGHPPRLALAWQHGTGGTSPVVAGGLLYVFDPGGRLNVYAPGTGAQLASLPAASGHWNSPIVAGGRVILPVGNANDHLTTGTLFIYHLAGR